MRLIIIIVLYAACFLSACSGSSSSSAPPSSSTGGSGTPVSGSGQGQPGSGPVIDNEDMTPGLKGIDADKNGIRDDIDRLIAKKYSATPELKKAVEQRARALQKSMEATTRQQSLIAGDEIMRAGRCSAKLVLRKGDASSEKLFLQIGNDLRALTGNTKERFTAYWNSANLSKGAVFEQPKEPVCD
jgi:hypothetical protein